jgi:queuine/archaeosine tRNA-ribosyltransferase
VTTPSAFISEVFICYARDDAEAATRIYEQLQEAGLKPWMDSKNLVPGANWDQTIQKAIRASQYFLVLLTDRSVTKRGYLQKEIKRALDFQDEKLDSDRYLIPTRMDRCTIPDRLAHLQCADLFQEGGWASLVAALSSPPVSERKAPGAGPPSVQRLGLFPIGGLPTPCFFPSVSSAAKNTLTPLQHLEILSALKHPLFLISAFDVARASREERLKINGLLTKSIEQGQTVLMDSGMYERKWLKSKWPKRDFHETLRHTPCHIAFCYDHLEPVTATVSAQVEAVVRAVLASRRTTSFQAIMPIVHASKPRDFPAICRRVAEELDPSLIAVPERELGDGIYEGVETMMKIRAELDATGRYYSVHILGTGNPLSMLMYGACGADSFDGLDWCQTIVDHTTGLLYHSQQLDFFGSQTPYGSDRTLSYLARAFSHNLSFYRSWLASISEATEAGSLGKMCATFLPGTVTEFLRLKLPGFPLS